MEREFISWLREFLPTSDKLVVGIGDDAAVVRWPERDQTGQLVVTTDALSDQVDFVLEQVDPRDIGHKALGINLSDLAAMAARPVAGVVSLVLPRHGGAGLSSLELAKELYRGMTPLAARFGLAIAGGDTNAWDGPLVISIAAFGCTTPAGPLLRSGARPGDWVLATGAFGGSILGRHLHVEPRIEEALALRQRFALSAGMDVSDGLALDASRLAEASGCGVALRLSDVPIAGDAVRWASSTGRAPIDHALGDGEDFELLLTAPPEAAQQIIRDQPIAVPISCIGQCVEQRGLWTFADNGSLHPLAATGYTHS